MLTHNPEQSGYYDLLKIILNPQIRLDRDELGRLAICEIRERISLNNQFYAQPDSFFINLFFAMQEYLQTIPQIEQLNKPVFMNELNECLDLFLTCNPEFTTKMATLLLLVSPNRDLRTLASELNECEEKRDPVSLIKQSVLKEQIRIVAKLGIPVLHPIPKNKFAICAAPPAEGTGVISDLKAAAKIIFSGSAGSNSTTASVHMAP